MRTGYEKYRQVANDTTRDPFDQPVGSIIYSLPALRRRLPGEDGRHFWLSTSKKYYWVGFKNSDEAAEDLRKMHTALSG